MYKTDGIEISWLGHDSFKINFTKLIYTDPFRLREGLEPADLILITHDHYDHCSPDDIIKILKDDTLIFCTPDCLSRLSRLEKGDVKVIAPGEKIKISEMIEIEAIPAYNTNKFRSPRQPFHPKENEWVGYIIKLRDKRIYLAGDTDFIPEMKELKGIDVALVPVSGTYVMTADEAATAVNSFKPKVAIPMHYGEIVGKAEDAQRFKEKANVDVVILGKE